MYITAIPKVYGTYSISLKPAFASSALNSSYLGNSSTDFAKYLYAGPFLENIFPIVGITELKYTLYANFNILFLGLANSTIASMPPFLVTRYISFRHSSRLSKFLIPKKIVTASKLSSLKFSFSALPIVYSGSLGIIGFSTEPFSLLFFSFATASIPSDISAPVTVNPCFQSAMQESPVPQAISRREQLSLITLF